MRIAILGCSGHWRLAAEGVSAGRADIEWCCAPVATGAILKKDSCGVGDDAVSIPGTSSTHSVRPGLLQPDGTAFPLPELENMAPVMEVLRRSGASKVESVSDWRMALENFNPAIAVVNPPFHLQTEVIMECLRRGIHVFSEKPMALSKTDLDRLRASLRATAAPKLMAMLTMRYEPGILAGRKFLASGTLGTPLLISVEKSYPLIGWDGKPRPGFYRSRATYGGTIPWIGVHALDLIRWFSGSEFRRVEAWHSTAGNDGMGDMEVSAALQLRLDRGATAVVKLDFLKAASRGPHRVDAIGQSQTPARWGDDSLRVACELGILEVINGRARVQSADGETRELPQVEGLDMFADFLAWVDTGSPMLLETRDCLLATEAALLARDAADQNRAVAF